MNPTEKTIQKEAREMLQRGTTAREFSEMFFGPEGRLRELWRNDSERRQVVQTDLYRWLQAELAGLRRTEAEAFEQEIQGLSGRVTIVIPKSLHAALKREAQIEGISLSELMRLKLAVKFSQSAQRLTTGRKTRAPGSRRSAG